MSSEAQVKLSFVLDGLSEALQGLQSLQDTMGGLAAPATAVGGSSAQNIYNPALSTGFAPSNDAQFAQVGGGGPGGGGGSLQAYAPPDVAAGWAAQSLYQQPTIASTLGGGAGGGMGSGNPWSAPGSAVTQPAYSGAAGGGGGGGGTGGPLSMTIQRVESISIASAASIIINGNAGGGQASAQAASMQNTIPPAQFAPAGYGAGGPAPFPGMAGGSYAPGPGGMGGGVAVGNSAPPTAASQAAAGGSTNINVGGNGGGGGGGGAGGGGFPSMNEMMQHAFPNAYEGGQAMHLGQGLFANLPQVALYEMGGAALRRIGGLFRGSGAAAQAAAPSGASARLLAGGHALAGGAAPAAAGASGMAGAGGLAFGLMGAASIAMGIGALGTLGTDNWMGEGQTNERRAEILARSLNLNALADLKGREESHYDLMARMNVQSGGRTNHLQGMLGAGTFGNEWAIKGRDVAGAVSSSGGLFSAETIFGAVQDSERYIGGANRAAARSQFRQSEYASLNRLWSEPDYADAMSNGRLSAGDTGAFLTARAMMTGDIGDIQAQSHRGGHQSRMRSFTSAVRANQSVALQGSEAAIASVGMQGAGALMRGAGAYSAAAGAYGGQLGEQVSAQSQEITLLQGAINSAASQGAPTAALQAQLNQKIAQRDQAQLQMQTLPLQVAQYTYSAESGAAGAFQTTASAQLEAARVTGQTSFGAGYGSMRRGLTGEMGALGNLISSYQASGVDEAFLAPLRAQQGALGSRVGLLGLQQREEEFGARQGVFGSLGSAASARLGAASLTSLYGPGVQQGFGDVQANLSGQLRDAERHVREVFSDPQSGEGLRAEAIRVRDGIAGAIAQVGVQQFGAWSAAATQPGQVAGAGAQAALGAVQATGQIGATLEGAAMANAAGIQGMAQDAFSVWQASKRYGVGSPQELSARQQYQSQAAQAQSAPLQAIQTTFAGNYRYSTMGMEMASTGMGLAYSAGESGAGILREGLAGVASADEGITQSQAYLRSVQSLRPDQAGAEARRGAQMQVMRAEGRRNQLFGEIASVGPSVGLREQMSQAGFAADVLSNTPGAYGNLRGAYSTMMSTSNQMVRELSNTRQGLIDSGAPADAIHQINEQIRGSAMQGYQAFNQLSFGWQSRIQGTMLNARGNMDLSSRGFSMMDAVTGGVVNPHFGATRGQLPAFLEWANIASQPGLPPGVRGPVSSPGRSGFGVFGMPMEGGPVSGRRPASESNPKGAASSSGEISGTIEVKITFPDGSSKKVPVTMGQANDHRIDAALPERFKEFGMQRGQQS